MLLHLILVLSAVVLYCLLLPALLYDAEAPTDDDFCAEADLRTYAILRHNLAEGPQWAQEDLKELQKPPSQ